jgi:hypothetical protein
MTWKASACGTSSRNTAPPNFHPRYRSEDRPGAALKSFDSSSKDRQRILLFLGDGLSTHNPMSERTAWPLPSRWSIARSRSSGPLGIQLDPKNLHGLAHSTGGVVLRTRIEEETLVDALKRYEPPSPARSCTMRNCNCPRKPPRSAPAGCRRCATTRPNPRRGQAEESAEAA